MRKSSWLRFALTAALLLLTPLTFAKALPSGVTAGPSYGGISEYRLDNGLKVLLYPDPSKPRMLVNVTYLVGSKHENYGETGMAHLLEHLVFKGTPKYLDVAAEFAKRGMRWNGTTWADRTNYFEVFEASDEQLQWALEFEASRMLDSFIARKDLDSEMTVVRNEMEMGETNPFRVSLKALQSAAFMWHNYGNDTIGARSDVERVDIDKLKAFYRTYYQPDNAVLLIAGPIEVDETLAQVARIFGPMPKPTRTLPPQYTVEPQQDGEREATIRRIAGSPLLAIGYHTPGAASPDTIALNTAGLILGDSETGRLRAQLVDKGLAASAANFQFSFQERALTIFLIQLSGAQDIAKARSGALAQIEAGAAKPFTQAEFERAQINYRNQLKSRLDDVAQLGIEMSEYIALGDWRTFFWEAQALERVTLADVNRVAATYLIQSNRTLVNYLSGKTPVRVEIPAPPPIDELMATLEPEKAQEATAQFSVSPLDIEKKTARSTTPSGIKLALLDKPTRNDAVSFYIQLGLGSKETLVGKATAAEAMGALLYTGTEGLSRVELNDATAKLESEVRAFSTGVDSVTITGRSTTKHIAALLDLIASSLKKPRFDATEFESWRAQRLSQLEQAKLNPQARASEEMSRLTNPYAPGHPLAHRSSETIESEVTAIKLADARAYHDAFFGAQSMQAAIVGEIDPAQISAQIEALFGKWRAPTAYVRMEESLIKQVSTAAEIDTPEQANAILLGSRPVAMNDQAADYPALTVGAYIFGGGALSNRLLKRLRQKEGFSYGGGVLVRPSSTLEETSSLLLFAQAAPENVRKASNAAREELDAIVKDGITETELTDAKSGLLKARRVGLSDDAALASTLALQAEIGRTFAYTDELESNVAKLTVAQVNEAVAAQFGAKTWTFVVAGDAKKMANAVPGAEQSGEKK